MKKQALGFIGIGLMGFPMVQRLLVAGNEVNVWNRTQSKLAPLIEKGAKASHSIEDLVTNSEVILLCLSDTVAVETVVFNDILDIEFSGKLFIDLSSIDPEVTRSLAGELQKQKQSFWVDAPVSGGTLGAEQGTLAIMAGGEQMAIEMAREVLKPLYGRFTYMGQSGSGQITKICNQMLVGCNLVVMAEMMALAKAAGVEASRIPEALSGGFADSKPLQIVGPQMATNQFEPVKWKVKTLLKDLTMATKLAAGQNTAVPMSGLAAQLMQQHGRRHFLEKDPSTLIELYQNSIEKSD
jgi:3-hydroxyisobutyrate dehydrogenase